MADRIRVIRPSERSADTMQTSGMKREAAISRELTGTQNLWVGLVTTPAGMDGGWHHHGNCESAIYVVSGRARFSWGTQEDQSVEVSMGDFLAVAPNLIHKEQALGDEPFVMVVARGCGNAITENVDLPEEFRD